MNIDKPYEYPSRWARTFLYLLISLVLYGLLYVLYLTFERKGAEELILIFIFMVPAVLIVYFFYDNIKGKNVLTRESLRIGRVRDSSKRGQTYKWDEIDMVKANTTVQGLGVSYVIRIFFLDNSYVIIDAGFNSGRRLLKALDAYAGREICQYDKEATYFGALRKFYSHERRRKDKYRMLAAVLYMVVAVLILSYMLVSKIVSKYC